MGCSNLAGLMGANDGAGYDYGHCACTGMYQGQLIEVEMDVAGRTVVITAIPQGECPRCGSQVYKMQVIERMESILRAEKPT